MLESIKAYKPTIFPGVPSIYTAINQARNVREYGLGTIKACISGAAPLPIEVQEKFEKLTHGRLVEGYGLTEASPVTHANPFDGPSKPGAMGIPIPNTDAKIVDLVSGEELPRVRSGSSGYADPRSCLAIGQAKASRLIPAMYSSKMAAHRRCRRDGS